MIGIYCITNKINGKIYVGQSINIEQRWKAHRTKPYNPNDPQYDSFFYRAIRKYGIENFEFSILEQCSEELLDERECYWIDKLNSFSAGYNLTPGGGGKTFSKLKEEEVNTIINLLQSSSLSQEEIAKRFNISQRSVSSINLGQTWQKNCLTYPLRKKSSSQYYCPQCGNPVSAKGNKCQNCAKMACRTVKRPSREELKSLIRQESFISIGQRYGVSDNAIKKWCKFEKLPHRKKDIKNYSDLEWAKI